MNPDSGVDVLRCLDSAAMWCAGKSVHGSDMRLGEVRTLVAGLIEAANDLDREMEAGWNARTMSITAQLSARITAFRAALAQVEQGRALPRDPYGDTDDELIRDFLRICRDNKPVGQWPGERLCLAIERALDPPRRDFISDADKSPRRGHNGRGGDADQMTSHVDLPINDAVPAPTQIQPGNLFLWNWRAMQEYARAAVAAAFAAKASAGAQANVLAVLDREIEAILNTKAMVDFSMNAERSDAYAQQLTDLTEARAAIAELIAADKEFDEANSAFFNCQRGDLHAMGEALDAARARRASALAELEGAP